MVRVLKAEEIKSGSFVRKGMTIYFVKRFIRDGNEYRLDFHFKLSKKGTSILHINGYNKFRYTFFEGNNFKLATSDEIRLIIERICKEIPEAKCQNFKDDDSSQTLELWCVKFLQNQGYLVFKQF